MAKAKHRVHLIDIQVAILSGLKDLFDQWQKENVDSLDPQMLRAAIEALDQVDNTVWRAFCAETGHSQEDVHDWTQGRRAPSVQMAAIYLNMLIVYIVKRTEELLQEKEVILNPPQVEEETSSDALIDLPKERITGFVLPDGLSEDTELATLEGFEDLPARLLGCLRNDNISTVANLIKVEGLSGWAAPLLRTPNFGKKSLRYLYQFMVEAGFEPQFSE